MLFLSVPYILHNILKMVNETHTLLLCVRVCVSGGTGVVWKSYLAINYPLLCSNVQWSESERVWGSLQAAVHRHIPLLQSTTFTGSAGLCRKVHAVAESSVSH